MKLRRNHLFQCAIGTAIAIGSLLGTACTDTGPNQSASQQQLVVTGSSTVAPLVSDLARAFEAQNPGVRVDVHTGGSSRGIADVRHGLAGIGMVSRALGDSEADLAGYTLAVDGVALIVNASNRLENITHDQVVAVYMGRIRDWRELGGTPGPITVVHKADGRSTQEVFLANFGMDPGDVEPSVVIGDNEQGVKSVAGNPAAIGYVSIGAAEASIGMGVPIKLIALDGHGPTSKAVAQGSFPLVRELNLVTVGELSQLAVEFIAFSRSPSAREFIEAHHFVALD
jgi:phosphate transport system substrate-binding protein